MEPERNPAIDANTRTALKPGAVGPVTMHRSGRAEVFADSTELAEVLPGPSGHPLP